VFKKLVKTVLIALTCIITLGVVKAYVFVPELQRQGEIMAYRGGGGPVNYGKLNKTGCAAHPLKESSINSVENTQQAMPSSVTAGANVIPLNVHRTSDDQVIVFHDWTLDCATEGAGSVHKASFEQLKNIDAGYTFDDGSVFPLEGKALGFPS